MTDARKIKLICDALEAESALASEPIDMCAVASNRAAVATMRLARAFLGRKPTDDEIERLMV